MSVRSEELTLDLPLGDYVEPERPAPEEPPPTIQERFDAFHRANPWVYDSLVVLTRDWLARGHQRAGMKQLLEVIRWEHGRRTSSDEGFKINNDFTSRYVRLLVHHHPEWADVFETRRLRAR